LWARHVRDVDPNDRGNDREMENAVKRRPPATLDALMSGENDDETDDAQ
jgi:hypothetical protein